MTWLVHLRGPAIYRDDPYYSPAEIAALHFKWTGRRVSKRRVRRLLGLMKDDTAIRALRVD